MANILTTNVDLGSVELHGGEFADELLTLAGAATVKKGTILARDSVSLKLVPYVKAGSTNNNGIAKAVLTYEASIGGAGDIAVRALVKGTVNRNRLVIHADGDGSNIDAVELDGLRDYQIVATDVSQLDRYDNPQGEGGADS